MTTLPDPTPLQTEIASQSADRQTQSAARSATRRTSKVKLTVRLLERMQPGDVLRDTELGGFSAECGQRGGIALKLACDVEHGRTVRRTLGKWPALELNEARRMAAALRAEVRAGHVPPTTRAVAAAAPPGELTVAVAIDRYVEDMTLRGCAAKTLAFTSARLRKHLAEWLARPIVGVLPSDCQTAHKRITASAGDVAANKVLRDFRATWNLAVKQSDQPERFAARCPVGSVTMNVEASVRANAVITDLPGWWQRTGDLGNPLRACMFRLGLLSGLRPGNLAGIRREWLDLTPGREVIRFPAAAMKGRAGKRRAFTLPLSPAMVALVRAALELGPKLVSVPSERCAWLFPTTSRDGRSVVATSNWTEPTLDANECGHSLRHTYRTLSADAGVPYDVAEMLVAHVLPGVGSRYVHAGELDTRLRAAQCQVSAHILALCGANEAAVVPAPPARPAPPGDPASRL